MDCEANVRRDHILRDDEPSFAPLRALEGDT